MGLVMNEIRVRIAVLKAQIKAYEEYDDGRTEILVIGIKAELKVLRGMFGDENNH